MKTNGGRRSEEILREIESTRSDMDHTLTAIERKLTPGQLVDQGLDYLRGSGANEFVHNLGGSVKQNPLPVALVGIGLAWLMAGGRNGGGTSTHAMRDWSEGTASRISEASDRAKERVGQAKQGLGDAKQTLSDTAHSARERLSRTAEGARQQFDRARGGYEWMIREQPLALGAIGVAVGALLAAAAPRTRTEDELMGEKRDELMDQAKEAGKEQLDKAKDVANKAASAATSEAQRQGTTPSSGSSATPSRPSFASPSGSSPGSSSAPQEKPESPGKPATSPYPPGQPKGGGR